MPRSLPPKNKVLDLLATLRESLEANEIAKQLGVEEKSFPGFLRLLDDLALNGDVAWAHGETNDRAAAAAGQGLHRAGPSSERSAAEPPSEPQSEPGKIARKIRSAEASSAGLDGGAA
jgi:hypothetical protein